MLFRRIRVIVISITVLFFGFLLLLRQPILEGDEALQKFFQQEVPEESIMDPLILAGKSVVPSLIKRIKEKEMPRRNYAILALGNIGDPVAIPDLKSLLNDDSEIPETRCNALGAIILIDDQLGRNLSSEPLIAQLCDQSLLFEAWPPKRSYIAAFFARQ